MKHITREFERRDVVKIGCLTALGLGLTDLLGLRAEATATGRTSTTPRAKSCVLLWLDGGPSHLDTFDPKPDAPKEVRGPFRAIPTAAPGVRICELMPETAKVMNRLAVIRSVTSPLGEHNFGSHYVLTGYKPNPALVYPSFGSLVAHTRSDAPRAVLPPFINVGNRPNGMLGPGYLPGEAAPFVVAGDPGRPGFKVRDLDFYPGVTEERISRRRKFLNELDAFSRTVESDARGTELAAKKRDPLFEQAYNLVTSPDAKRAFDVSDESPETRKRYGHRTLGQGCLIARRLVERGVPFVTVTDRGWDTHTDLDTRLREGYTGGHVGKVPVLDLALSALIEDLRARSLLEETLVVVMGEFGRTPKVNTAGGRDHWPRVFSVALAGAGVPGGLVVGESDSVGESPAERPVTPSDVTRTLLTILGIDPTREFRTSDGRPVKANSGGNVIKELVG